MQWNEYSCNVEVFYRYFGNANSIEYSGPSEEQPEEEENSRQTMTMPRNGRNPRTSTSELIGGPVGRRRQGQEVGWVGDNGLVGWLSGHFNVTAADER